MEPRITLTQSHEASFEHDDTTHVVSWADDSNSVYIQQRPDYETKNWKTILIEKEALPLLIEVLQKAASTK
jgi:hypothetical protein